MTSLLPLYHLALLLGAVTSVRYLQQGGGLRRGVMSGTARNSSYIYFDMQLEIAIAEANWCSYL